MAREGGGVPGMGRDLLEGVLRQGAAIDLYTQEANDCLARFSSQFPKLRVRQFPAWFQWDRWYSRGKFASFISSTIARSQAAKKISRAVIDQHAVEPYDCVFQLSQTELFELGKNIDRLPPLIVYPCVHAAGELRWHRIESRYALQSERAVMHYLTRVFLIFRSFVQRRDLRKPATVVGMSRRFNELIVQDYGVDPAKTAVLYHPIQQVESTAQATDAVQSPLKLLYIARISVRKGVEMIVELSKRLQDLEGKVQIEVIGDRTLWSDYTGHLKELNASTAVYSGQLKNSDVRSRLATAAGMLLPSHYEPGGLVVGEALAAGVPVVVSNEVGSGEPVDDFVCRKFKAGDMDEFEKQVRQLLKDAQSYRAELQQKARAEADRHFAPDLIARQLLAICTETAFSGKTKPAATESVTQ